MNATLKPGDLITVKVKEGSLVSSYSLFDEEKDFQIIGVDEGGYYLYIPDYIPVKDTFKLDERACRVFDIAKQFSGENSIYISPSFITSIKMRLDGLSCSICSEFFQYAEANNEDGSLTCFICRNYYWYK